MDSSLVYGRNEMDFTIDNTLNRSIGTRKPDRFDAGGFEYDQLVYNLSGVRPVEFRGSPRRSTSRSASKHGAKRSASARASRIRIAMAASCCEWWSDAVGRRRCFPGFRPSDTNG